jgi:hypothetical protein
MLGEVNDRRDIVSMQAFVDQERKLLQYLDDETCIRAYRGHGEALLLDFRLYHPPDPGDPDAYQQPDRGLVIEACAWRLENETHVIVGSENTYETIDILIQICVGKRVEEIHVYHPSFMVHIRFTEGLALWIFPDDSARYTDTDEGHRMPWYVAGRSVR